MWQTIDVIIADDAGYPLAEGRAGYGEEQEIVVHDYRIARDVVKDILDALAEREPLPVPDHGAITAQLYAPYQWRFLFLSRDVYVRADGSRDQIERAFKTRCEKLRGWPGRLKAEI